MCVVCALWTFNGECMMYGSVDLHVVIVVLMMFCDGGCVVFVLFI